ncbi:hypothetical protein ABT383_38750, partial [Streptomyces humidus]|uniref:hypothetical protein n=1 Tax=Streptomyces humidus TaxID=52259 RepID=UPI0033270CD3
LATPQWRWWSYEPTRVDWLSTAQPCEQPACLGTTARVGRGTAHLLDRAPPLGAPAELLDALDDAHRSPPLVCLRSPSARSRCTVLLHVS